MTITTLELSFGTRRSRLALWQTRHVADALRRLNSNIAATEVPISTEGDRDPDTPLPEIGGKGLFTEELERSLIDGEIDLAVHSLKDLPTESRSELTLGAVCFRSDPRDVIISKHGVGLRGLSSGASIATSSNRRSAQLRLIRPDVVIEPLRGNVDTRVAIGIRGEFDGVCLAAAGVQRLGMVHCITEYLSLEQFLPAPGQGALAIQCRACDERVRELLAGLDEPNVRAAVTAERSFLIGLGGGCSAPVGAFAKLTDPGILELRGLVAAIDGSRVVRVVSSGSSDDPEQLGLALAEEAVAQGAGDLLP
ncbi:MAG: hydroxymethylbilane synthase [Gemmatimonadales bacterium]